MLSGTWDSILRVSLDTDLFLSRNSRQYNPYHRRRDGEPLSDSAGTGGASIPNYWHHQASDLLMEGAFILDFFRQNHLRELFVPCTGRKEEKGASVCLSSSGQQLFTGCLP